ncbi:aldehyde dehydrogenase family protein [Subtercola lobariae]|uniref:Aldehyde dehydrogenase n=1 Tax=Subtercola lobariae TaxID=1588641 RepID=A0A917EZX0_9MICO|nr:aldehyde dehydrogenase family protein [Subtercola lobariae]GGF38140.1 aldehyde dehydrogenase [Subtercola lobariae]
MDFWRTDNDVDARHIVDRPWKVLAGGEPFDTAATYEIENPSTGGGLADAPDASAEEVDRLVRLAATAQPAWGALTPRERAGKVRQFAALMIEHREELATLDSLDMGAPLRSTRLDVDGAVELMNIFADYALELGGRTIPVSKNLHYTTSEPYGVIARIGAFNHPLFFAASKAAAPLIAGNAVILKAPDQAPLSTLRLAELAAEVLPPDVLIAISGRGMVSGRAIVAHPLIRRIGFIGSAATGRSIQKDAADAGVKHVTLELGGKNAQIVLPDADLAAAAAGVVAGMNFTMSAGQSCGSTSRLLLHESIADEVQSRVAAILDGIRVGDPMNESNDMGSLISKAQYDKSLHYIDVGVKEGGSILSGGGRPSTVGSKGWFVSPTLITQVAPESTLAQEEVFGPVLAAMTFGTVSEAVEIANSVEYGLTASVWTSDLTSAHQIARDLKVGHVLINSPSRHFWGLPFGGTKSSGFGREECLEELLSYAETKTTTVVLP